MELNTDIRPNIFGYQDPQEYLVDVFQDRKTVNPRFSLRSWTKKAGLAHAGLLSMVLNGRRKLKPSLVLKLIPTLKLNERERRYLEFLVLQKNAKSPEERELYQTVLNDLRPKTGEAIYDLSLDRLRVFSNWYSIAIWEMTELSDFRPDPKWISNRLDSKVSISVVLIAIERMIRLGVLKKDSAGKLTKTFSRFETPTDIPSQDLKRLHENFLAKAKNAIHATPISRRDITSQTFTLSARNMNKIKNRISQFRIEIEELGAMDQHEINDNEVYQMNIQLFPLTIKQAIKPDWIPN